MSTNTDQFIELFAEALERDGEIRMVDEFRNYPEWSSITYLSLIAMMDEEYGVQIEEEDFRKLRTVQALYEACANH
jgi:acyl carrier protein